MVGSPPGGQGNTSAAAFKQTQPERLFRLADLLADRTDRNTKLDGSGRNAAASAESFESLYGAQRERVLHLGYNPGVGLF